MLNAEDDKKKSAERGKKKCRFGIPGEVEFHSLLKHERHRTDRSGQCFSVILIDIKYLVNDKKFLKQYINQIHKRIRLVDVLGWFWEFQTLGILLVSTDLVNARLLTDEFKKKLPVDILLPAAVYCYPHNWDNICEKPESANKLENQSLLNKKVIKKMENLFVQKLPGWKRTIDIGVSLIAFIMFSPLFLLISLYIKFISPGPVFFRQKRIGLNGKEFTLFKFRTMQFNNDISNHKIYLKELIKSEKPMYKMDIQKDSRIISGGYFLRKSGLDELPQFINILKGEMSLVGPRPSIPYEVTEFSLWHKSRFNLTPGLTGLWQVSGKNKLSFTQMIRLDIEYGKKLSLWLDLLIILKTFPTILKIISEKATGRTRIWDASG